MAEAENEPSVVAGNKSAAAGEREFLVFNQVMLAFRSKSRDLGVAVKPRDQADPATKFDDGEFLP